MIIFDPYTLDLFLKQRQNDLLAQAEKDRRAKRVRSYKPFSSRFPKHLLVGLGKILVSLGYRLQSRYPDGDERPEYGKVQTKIVKEYN